MTLLCAHVSSLISYYIYCALTLFFQVLKFQVVSESLKDTWYLRDNSITAITDLGQYVPCCHDSWCRLF